jgi:hypothetical protein
MEIHLKTKKNYLFNCQQGVTQNNRYVHQLVIIKNVDWNARDSKPVFNSKLKDMLLKYSSPSSDSGSDEHRENEQCGTYID